MQRRPRTSRRLLASAAVLTSLGLGAAGLTAQQHPDFTGVWTTYTEPGAGRGGRGGGRGGGAALPLRPDAQEKIAHYRSLIEGTGASPGGYCLGTGMPGSMLGSGGYPMEIVQRPEEIVIVYEAHNEVRRVYLGDRIVPMAERLPGRNGHSSGRWDGETLVVETTHLVEQVDQRYAHSSEAAIVERYHLERDADDQTVLVAEMTLTDPVFYTEPVTATKKWAKVPNGHLLPYECAEEGWLNFLDEREALVGGSEAQ